ETDDGDLRAGTDPPAAQRRPRRDAGAQQRRGDVEPDPLRDPQHEVRVDDDVGGVAALGDRAVAVLRRVRADLVGAVLLVPRTALLALTAGVHEATDADPVTHGVR